MWPRHGASASNRPSCSDVRKVWMMRRSCVAFGTSGALKSWPPVTSQSVLAATTGRQCQMGLAFSSRLTLPDSRMRGQLTSMLCAPPSLPRVLCSRAARNSSWRPCLPPNSDVVRHLDCRHALSVYPHVDGVTRDYGHRLDEGQRHSVIEVLARLHEAPVPPEAQPATRGLYEEAERTEGLACLEASGGPVHSASPAVAPGSACRRRSTTTGPSS